MIKIELEKDEYSGILKPKAALFPKIWKNNKINPIVARKLMQIADEVIKSLELDVEEEDVIITGSIASYNWHEKSDIDLHIMFDFEKINQDVELVKKMFDQTKINWNKKHNIQIAGKEVEIYFQDYAETHEANGIWSLELEKWLAAPVRLNPEIDIKSAEKKAESLAKSIDHLFELYKEEKHKEVYDFAGKIKQKISNMRKSGLQEEGIYSPENLAFKMLRSAGWLEKLSALKITAYDQMMSLELENKQIDENKVWRNYLVQENN
jgi:predicted nucleotidyltransferase